MTNSIKEFGRYLISRDIVESCRNYKKHLNTSKLGDAVYGITSGVIRYGSFFLMCDGIQYAVNNPGDAFSSLVEAGIGVIVAVDSANRFRRKECLISKLDSYKSGIDGLKAINKELDKKISDNKEFVDLGRYFGLFKLRELKRIESKTSKPKSKK
jgi:hypothetical protein